MKDEIEKTSKRARKREKERRGEASGLERFRQGFLSRMAAGAGFFYSKCEFLARGIFPLSPSFIVHTQLYIHIRAYIDEHARVRARVRALVSDDGAGNGVSDETELTQVDLPRRWRGAPDT